MTSRQVPTRQEFRAWFHGRSGLSLPGTPAQLDKLADELYDLMVVLLDDEEPA